MSDLAPAVWALHLAIRDTDVRPELAVAAGRVNVAAQRLYPRQWWREYKRALRERPEHLAARARRDEARRSERLAKLEASLAPASVEARRRRQVDKRRKYDASPKGKANRAQYYAKAEVRKRRSEWASAYYKLHPDRRVKDPR